MKSKTWMLIISIIALVVFALVIIYGFTAAPHGAGSQDRSHPAIPIYIISISGIVLIIALVPLFYYVIYSGLEKNYEKNMEILSKIVGDNNKAESKDSNKANCTKVILNFMSYGEKKVIDKLIEQNGTALQSEISRIEGMGKVKTHRVVKDLERKGVIAIEKYGNTNRINLTESVSNILIK